VVLQDPWAVAFRHELRAAPTCPAEVLTKAEALAKGCPPEAMSCLSCEARQSEEGSFFAMARPVKFFLRKTSKADLTGDVAIDLIKIQ